MSKKNSKLKIQENVYKFFKGSMSYMKQHISYETYAII